MNKKKLQETIGMVVRLRPRPKYENNYVNESRNKWNVICQSEGDKGLLLQNTLTDHEFTLGYDSIHDFKMPDILVLRAQPFLTNDTTVTLEPFTDTPDQFTTDLSAPFVAETERIAQTEFERLSDAEKSGLLELLYRDMMTDTDIANALLVKGYRCSGYYQQVSQKCSFLKRDFGGYNSIIPIFKPILMKLLKPGSQ